MKNFFLKLGFSLRLLTILSVSLTPNGKIFAQPASVEPDAAMIRRIYDQALTDGRSYAWLDDLCHRVGHRLSGSPGAAKAVQWSKAALDTVAGLDSVWLQPIMVPHWERGAAEQVRIVGARKGERPVDLPALALGGSVATARGGLTAPVVEVTSWDQLEQLGERGLRGRIVFFNRPMDPTRIRTFEAYGGAVDQRVFGAARAAKYGAVGVLVRSMGLRLDDYPHTGTLRYDTAFTAIPAVAISTNAAELLSRTLRERPAGVQVFMKLSCRMLPDAPSHNVIAEIRGTERPNDVIVVGGHLDSWDVGHGAHDDGAGCVQSMDVLRYLVRTGYRPRHTIRCVLFMNEENGGRGGDMYAAEAARKGERHVLAIESDAGGFTPRGFTFDGDAAVIDALFEKVSAHQALLEPYGLKLSRGGGGADIAPLKPQKALLSGYSPDSQRYFDLHHTAADVFSAVNKRELELGAASMAALVYLVDKYGL
jgi:carboxypeptidase Q